MARGREEKSNGKQRKRIVRDEEERTLGKRRGAKRSNEKQEYLKETETENRRRGRERQFLRKVVGRDGARAFFGRALLQFCAMQVWRWVQHSSHQLLAALTAYAVFQFQLNWNFSLSLSLREPGRLSGRFREREEEVQTALSSADDPRPRQWCQPLLFFLHLLLLPLRKVGGFVCKHGPSSCRSRAP